MSCSIKIRPVLALHGYGSIPTIEPSSRPTEKPPWTAVRTRAARHAKKHSMRVDASATQSPPPSTHSHAHVPKKHAQIHLRRVWPNAHGAVLFPPCTPEHYARQLHGSGHTRPLASAENVQETNTRLHVQARQIGAGAVAVRAHRGGVCVHTGDKSDVGEAWRQCVSVKMTPRYIVPRW